MKNYDSMKRLKAMAKAAEKLMKEQDEQKTRKAAEAYEDDSDLIRDMLLPNAIWVICMNSDMEYRRICPWLLNCIGRQLFRETQRLSVI